MALIRVLRTARATLTRTFAVDETPTDATGNVVVSVTRLDGTVVDAGTNATGPDANHTYSYIYAGSDTLDEVVVTWSATVAGDAIVLDSDRIQIAGGFLFSLSEGRGVDTVLSSPTKYPTARLVAARLETEDEAERICGQAFVPRFAREVLSGDGGPSLVLSRPWIRTVRAVSVRPTPGSAYVAFTSPQLLALTGGDDAVLRLDGGVWPAGVIGSVWPRGRRNIIVEYEHGRDYPPPDLVRGAKMRFKSLVLQPNSALPDRAERIATTETGVVILASPSRDKTGIPEVDAVYDRFPSPVPSFG